MGSFWFWLLFLGTRVLTIMHSVAYMGTLLFIAEAYSAVWTCQFVYPSPVDGHLGCFQFGATINKLLWTQVQVFVWTRLHFLFLPFRFSQCSPNGHPSPLGGVQCGGP